MQCRPLGSSGISASRIAFGAWAIGGWNWGGQDDAESIRAIHAALDAGINLIDTAPVYGFGRSEEVVGRAIAGRRDQVVIATKCGLRWDADRGRLFFRSSDDEITPHGDRAVHVWCSPESIRHEIEQSLRRLRVDAIDLLQTHWQDESTPISDTMAELMRLRDEGKVRALGACNASREQLDAYRAAGTLDVDQERYSLVDRGAEAERLPYCAEHRLAFLAYSPLANGLLTGKLSPDREFPVGDMRRVRPRFSVESRRLVAAALREIQPLAENYGVTLAQLAIAWTLAQPGVTHLLIGARNPAQVAENAAAATLPLTRTELDEIAAALAPVAPALGSAAPTTASPASPRT